MQKCIFLPRSREVLLGYAFSIPRRTSQILYNFLHFCIFYFSLSQEKMKSKEGTYTVPRPCPHRSEDRQYGVGCDEARQSRRPGLSLYNWVQPGGRRRLRCTPRVSPTDLRHQRGAHWLTRAAQGPL